MNLNEKFFSFPPFLSVSWNNVSALTVNYDGCLTFHITNGETVTLPEIPQEELSKIFIAHATFLENQVLNEQGFKPPRFFPNPKGRQEHELPIRFTFGTMDGIGSTIQHNSSQKNAPNLPDEMLSKLAEVSRILAPNDPEQLPKAEPHCNCPHCQIARALSGHFNQEHNKQHEEEVSFDELQFQQWEVTQTGEKLFNVTNKLDQLENYSVHLGNPIGCTCGKENCEHILAVLRN